jgi:hypothetical protein
MNNFIFQIFFKLCCQTIFTISGPEQPQPEQLASFSPAATAQLPG